MAIDHIYHAIATRADHIRVGPDKFVHVQVGLFIWCAGALLFRRSLRSPFPLMLCLFAEVCNEILDRHYAGSWNWPDTIGDAVATWFWPTALFLILRYNRAARS